MEDDVALRCKLGILQHGTSFVAAGIFSGLFLILTGLHLVQMINTRTWYLVPLFLGALRKYKTSPFSELCAELVFIKNLILVETVGYASRIGLAIEERSDDGCWSMGLYIISSVNLLIAPVLMAASIYMTLGRIILLTEGESHAMLRRQWLTKAFVTGDIVSLLLQSGGRSRSSHNLVSTSY